MAAETIVALIAVLVVSGGAAVFSVLIAFAATGGDLGRDDPRA